MPFLVHIDLTLVQLFVSVSRCEIGCNVTLEGNLICQSTFTKNAFFDLIFDCISAFVQA